MERNSQRLLLRGCDYSRTEFKYIQRFGTKKAWMRLASQSNRPEALAALFSEMKPWAQRPRPDLCGFIIEGKLYLVSEIWFRRPDDINGLTEVEFVEWSLVEAHSFEGHTKWNYLRGNASIPMQGCIFPGKREYGQPRKKSIPF